MKYTKNQERKWELQRRVKCHGNMNSCIKEHSIPSPFFQIDPSTISKKENTWNKLLKFLHIK
jgi:hypothetical protein